MLLTAADCWRLILQSRLLSPQHCQQLSAQYGRLHGEQQSQEAGPLIDWLVSQKVISRYQGEILLAGGDGPFYFGEYKVSDRVENGRLSGSLRAIHTETKHPVTLQLVEAKQSAASFAAAACRLEHPHIGRVYESFHDRSGTYLVREELEGTPLDEWQLSAGRVPTSKACSIAHQIAEALVYLHAADWTHGDLRLPNVWLERSGRVKLILDQQKSTFHGPPPAPTPSGPSQPSQVQAERADPGRDLQGLGCILYQLVTSSAIAVIPATAGPQWRAVLSKLPRPLDELVHRLTTNDKKERVEAEWVAKQLRRLATGAVAPSPPPLPTAERYEQWLQSKRLSPGHDRNAELPTFPPTETHATASRVGEADSSRSQMPTVVAGGRQRTTLKVKRNRSELRQLLLGTVVAGGLFCLAITLASSWTRPRPVQSSGTTPSLPVPSEKLSETADQQPVAAGLPDDGETLWASPTHGDPVSLEHLPGGAQVLIFVRLSAMVASEEGRRVLDALGPDFHQLYAGWQAAAGVAPEDIESLVIGLFGNNGELPRISFTVRLRQPKSAAQLIQSWGDLKVETAGLTSYYVGSPWAYVLPARKRTRTFVMGHPTEIKELADAALRSSPLRREIARLARITDRDRHLNVLFAPRFLFGDGQALLALRGRQLVDNLETLLGDDIRAALLSMNFGEDLFYLELNAEFDSGVDRTARGRTLGARFAALPKNAEAALATQNPSHYWRIVAGRFPSMLGFLSDHLRIGVDRGITTLNAALPGPAAHNLAFGSEMLLSGNWHEVKGSSASHSTANMNSLEEALAAKLSVQFDQESLESGLETIETEFRARYEGLRFPFSIAIAGNDLKLEGITRNQQIRGFEQIDKTLAEILTVLVMQANPVVAANPSDPAQRILWVIGPAPDQPTQNAILITTRVSAAEKYDIPKIFRPTDANSES